ncbi:MAG: hypothetical protein RL072_1370 [Actinomycetota bacterium]|jgi:hypothetical protein
MVSLRIGLRGGTALADVDAAGFVRRAGQQTKVLGWWVAADDRWHDPRVEPSRRQRMLDGTPVIETKIAVPGGDVVQRAFMVADHGGCVVMEVANESPTAVVVAVPTDGLATDAVATPTEPRGVELPSDVRAFPLAHRSNLHFAWRADARPAPISAGAFASWSQVVRGWLSACERASRITLNTHSIVAARSELLLATVREIDDLLQGDAARGVLAIAERVRMGEPSAPHVEQVADAARRLLRKPRAQWAGRALVMAARVLAAADESLASSDVAAAWAEVASSAGAGPVGLASDEGRGNAATGAMNPVASAVDVVASAEDALVRAVSPHEAELFSGGLADAVRGVNLEAHGLSAGPQHTVSLAVRWHGPNAAVLWEVDGPPGLKLRAPRIDETFVVSSQRGEGLMRLGQ